MYLRHFLPQHEPPDAWPWKKRIATGVVGALVVLAISLGCGGLLYMGGRALGVIHSNSLAARLKDQLANQTRVLGTTNMGGVPVDF